MTRLANTVVHLHVRSWYSFLAGGSSPEQLAKAASQAGQKSLALTDINGLYGAVKFALACRQYGIRPIFGSQVNFAERPLTLLAANSTGYRNLCELISLMKLPEEPLTIEQRKAPGSLPLDSLVSYSEGLIALTGGPGSQLDYLICSHQPTPARIWLQQLAQLFPKHLYVELCNHRLPSCQARVYQLYNLAQELNLPVAATNDVAYATCEQYVLYDVLTCMRINANIYTPHPERPANDQAYLCSQTELTQRLPFPEAIRNTELIAEQCQVDILAVHVQPPHSLLPNGQSPAQTLRQLCQQALNKLYVPARRPQAKQQLDKELETIIDLELEEFFLTVYEIVQYAKGEHIRCSGRGSAANSIVAYLLGITTVCPLEHHLLFERFLHRGRQGMPDIDVDFDSERRMEVIKWVEQRFGRQYCAMTAAVVTFQIKNSLREILKVLGCTPEQISALAHIVSHWDTLDTLKSRRGELSAALIGQPAAKSSAANQTTTDSPAPSSLLIDILLLLLEQIRNCPRHLSLHNGGMVISPTPITQYTPLQQAANGQRQIQFDKDDIEALGLVKFDILGLRILSVLSEAHTLIQQNYKPDFSLESIPYDDQATFRLINASHTMSIFQIESPGQMNLLARTRPKCFKELVIQIALFRPGPLQGNMVKPYVERCQGRQQVTYLHPKLKPILSDTLGIILFQEQILEICHVFAGMTLEQADNFRRQLGRRRLDCETELMHSQFVSLAAAANQVSQPTASEVFRQLDGFAGYGFCRSHAASFARLVYQSAWLKRHYPAAYMTAVMQHCPGMYPLSTIREEIAHLGVHMLPISIRYSSDRYILEKGAIRLPLTAAEEVSVTYAQEIVNHRQQLATLEELVLALDIPSSAWESLAKAGAFQPEIAERRQALWRIGTVLRHKAKLAALQARTASRRTAGSKIGRVSTGSSETSQPSLFELRPSPSNWLRAHPVPNLGALKSQQALSWDFYTQGYSVAAHPLKSLRPQLQTLEALPIKVALQKIPGHIVKVAGLVVTKQRPPTAGGVIFVLLEDETARIQAVISPKLALQVQSMLRHSALLVTGIVQPNVPAADSTPTTATLLVKNLQALQAKLDAPILACHDCYS